ncbi:MAG: GspE/PulE family protein [Patescibacteria group bacterium]|nr:GspE/PulE family protein [Patescibacteria group bacterium]
MEEQIRINNLAGIRNSVAGLSQFQGLIDKNKQKEISALLEIMLAGAIVLDCSDIHLEPEEKAVKLRVRIDGLLHDVLFLQKELYQNILSRIKLLAGIKLNITEKSQDGRFTIDAGQAKIEVRVSTLPSEYGETLVGRILNPKKVLSVEELGVRPELLAVFKKEIGQPNGMIIVTGPTGSGKTTTLYAILKEIQNPQIKIITIEDPIEYHLPGVSQTQTDPEKGYDFKNGLSAIVRQDPDVILVGEIRDLETASIALQASLTGHLVLSTLHTNDAAGAIIRLQALGEKPTNIAPALNLVVAQRLVRKICPNCARQEKPTAEELRKLQNELSDLSPGPVKNETAKKLASPSLKIPHTFGCSFCNNTGYKGRIGIFEFFVVDDETENMILRSPSVPQLRKKAKEKGMISIKEDGFLKVVSGITSIEEIERTAGE